MRYIICLLLLGCGSQGSLVAGIQYQPLDVKPYMDKYLAEKQAHTGQVGVNYPIRVEFGHMEGRKLGLCRVYEDSNVRYIILEPTNWYTASDADKTQLVFHEMGHCDLDLDHGRGGLIMNETQISEWTFIFNYDRLVDELFGGM